MMVIVGGYETFVSRLRLEGHPDQPEWLSHVNASMLKVKLAMAIIGISSIHLLKTFIEVGDLGAPGSKFTEAGVMWQTIIPVSYTHLDVYKRQGHSRRSNCRPGRERGTGSGPVPGWSWPVTTSPAPAALSSHARDRSCPG